MKTLERTHILTTTFFLVSYDSKQLGEVSGMYKYVIYIIAVVAEAVIVKWLLWPLSVMTNRSSA